LEFYYLQGQIVAIQVATVDKDSLYGSGWKGQ